MVVRMQKEIGDLYKINKPVIIICDNNTYCFGRVHDNRTMGIENKNTSNNNSISSF
jgi:hypothetical protein